MVLHAAESRGGGAARRRESGGRSAGGGRRPPARWGRCHASSRAAGSFRTESLALPLLHPEDVHVEAGRNERSERLVCRRLRRQHRPAAAASSSLTF